MDHSSITGLTILTISILAFSNCSVLGESQMQAATQKTLLDPLKQLKSGIAISDIKCRYDYSLIIRETNGDPACVKPTTATRLITHGWITVEKFEDQHPITLQNKVSTSIPKNVNATNPLIANQNESNQISNQGTTASTITLNLTQDSSSHFPSLTNPLISSTKQGLIKILSIGMKPNQLKVGDIPDFTLTFQNISNERIVEIGGCDTIKSLHYTILPKSSVQEFVGSGQMRCATWFKGVEPNQTFTATGQSSTLNGAYQIIRPGMLNVTLDLYGGIKSNEELIAEAQFDVNATQ